MTRTEELERVIELKQQHIQVLRDRRDALDDQMCNARADIVECRRRIWEREAQG